MSIAEEKKQCITKAALAEFLEKGLGKASMQAISDAANVSKRTLYKYFPNKQCLFESLIIDLCKMHALDPKYFEYKSELSLKEQFTAIVKSDLETTLDDNYLKMARLIISEFLKSKPIDEKLKEQFEEMDEPFLNWIKMAQEDGKITKEYTNTQVLELYHAFYKGVVFLPNLIRYEEDLDYLKKENYEKILVNHFLKNFSL